MRKVMEEKVPSIRESIAHLLEYAASRILETEKLQVLEKKFHTFVDDPDTNRVQNLLLDCQTSVYNTLFFSGWLHLSQRSPLPLGENYSRLNNTNIAQVAAIYIAQIVKFYTLLPTFTDIRNGKTLDTVQYKNLFGSCRHPGIETDAFCKYEEAVDYITVLYNSDIYCVKVFNNKEVRDISSIIADVSYILSNNVTNKNSVCTLTSLKRDESFKLREHLCKLSLRNAQNLEIIDKSLFIVCLEPSVHLKDQFPSNEERIIFNYGKYRWYEKFQVIVTGNGRVAFNFEHSMIDSGPVHTFIEIIQGYPIESFSNEPESVSPPQRLEWDLDTFSQEILEQATFPVPKASCDVIIYCMGRDFMKSKNLSPDALTHVALHLALLKYYGTIRYFLETVDARNYKNARLQILPIFTAELRLFLEESLKGNSEQLPQLLINACNSHKSLICNENKRHFFLHVVFLSNELHLVPGPENEIVHDPIYQELLTHQVISSNLGYFKGIDFVYAGHPVDEDTMVLGFVIEDEKILITYTVPALMEITGLDQCIKEAFDNVHKLLDKL